MKQATKVREPKETRKFKAGSQLRTQIIDAASRLFDRRGYESVSVRCIANEVGCSQMALYAHFPDKNALMQHLCAALYERYTQDLKTTLAAVPDPRERLLQAIRNFVLLAVDHPHHYRLVFLTPNFGVASPLRDEIAEISLGFFRESLRLIFADETSRSQIDARLRQILALMHGMTAMLVVAPQAYGLTKAVALRELATACSALLELPLEIHSKTAQPTARKTSKPKK